MHYSSAGEEENSTVSCDRDQFYNHYRCINFRTFFLNVKIFIFRNTMSLLAFSAHFRRTLQGISAGNLLNYAVTKRLIALA